MLRKSKKFEWPRKLFDKPRILEENKLVTKYGLKNKKEIWKAESKIKYFRSRAKKLITAEPEEQQIFFSKLNVSGLNVSGIADVLALNKEDLLKRRLPTILVEQKKAKTPKEARQMVVHKRVLIQGRVVNVPGYIVKTDEEKLISLKPKKKKVPKAETTPAAEETSEKSAEENVEENKEEASE